MKKTILLSLLSLLMVAGLQTRAHSQVLIALLLGDKLNSDKLEFGVDVGLNYTTIDGIDGVEYKPGFSFGLYFMIKLNDHFYLHPMAVPKSTWGARNLTQYSLNDAALDTALAGASVKRRLEYIPVPLLVGYRTDFGLGIEVGPQLSLRTKALDIFEKQGVGEEDQVAYDRVFSKDHKPIDAGIAGALNYKLPSKKSKGMNITVRYFYGLTDMVKDNTGPAQRNSGFTFTLGIPVGAKEGGSDVPTVEE